MNNALSSFIAIDITVISKLFLQAKNFLWEKLVADAHDVHRIKSMNQTVSYITDTPYYVAAFNDTVLKHLVVLCKPQANYICEISSDFVVIISVYIHLYNYLV